MQKLLYYFTMFALVSVVVMATVSFFNVASAEELTNLRDEFTYGYSANLNRKEEQNRDLARQRYEQQQYMEQQERINQLDMYNQTRHYSGRESSYRSATGGGE